MQVELSKNGDQNSKYLIQIYLFNKHFLMKHRKQGLSIFCSDQNNF